MKEKEDTYHRQVEIEAAWSLHLTVEETETEARRRWLLFNINLQKGKCWYCGTEIVAEKIDGLEDRQATIDHIVPRSMGGEDIPNNTLAACAYCNGSKSDSDLKSFLKSTILRNRVRSVSICPDHVSADGSSSFYDSASINRGIAVMIDGREFKNVYEYCVSEGWVQLRLAKTKSRGGKPMTVLKRGEISVVYHDTRARLETLGSVGQIAEFDRWLVERPVPSK